MENRIPKHFRSLLKIDNIRVYLKLSKELNEKLRQSNKIDDFIDNTKNDASQEMIKLEKQEDNLLIINEELVIDFNRLKDIEQNVCLFISLILFKLNNGWDNTPEVIKGKISLLSKYISSKGERLCFESLKNESQIIFFGTFNDTFEKLDFDFENKFCPLEKKDKYIMKDRIHGLISSTIHYEISDPRKRFKYMLDKCSTFAINMHINRMQEGSFANCQFANFIAYFEFASAVMKKKYKEEIDKIKKEKNTNKIMKIWENVNPGFETYYDKIERQINSFSHQEINYNFLDSTLQTFKSAITNYHLRFDTVPLLIYHTCKHYEELNPNDYVKIANRIIEETSSNNINSNILQYGNGRRFTFNPFGENYPLVVVICQASSRRDWCKAILASYII